jgi:hypothetical protein
MVRCNVKIVLLVFVHRLNYKIIKLRFRSWILISSSGKKRGQRSENLSVGPPGLASLSSETTHCMPNILH